MWGEKGIAWVSKEYCKFRAFSHQGKRSPFIALIPLAPFHCASVEIQSASHRLIILRLVTPGSLLGLLFWAVYSGCRRNAFSGRIGEVERISSQKLKLQEREREHECVTATEGELKNRVADHTDNRSARIGTFSDLGSCLSFCLSAFLCAACFYICVCLCPLWGIECLECERTLDNRLHLYGHGKSR